MINDTDDKGYTPNISYQERSEWNIDSDYVGSFASSPAAIGSEDLATLLTDPAAKCAWSQDMSDLSDWVEVQLGKRPKSSPNETASPSYGTKPCERE